MLLWHCHSCLVFMFLSCLVLTQDPVKDFSLHLNVISFKYLCSRTFLFFFYLWHCSIEVSCFTECFSFWIHLITGVIVAGFRWSIFGVKMQRRSSVLVLHVHIRGSGVTLPSNWHCGPWLRRWLLDFSSVCTSHLLHRFWVICDSLRLWKMQFPNNLSPSSSQ